MNSYQNYQEAIYEQFINSIESGAPAEEIQSFLAQGVDINKHRGEALLIAIANANSVMVDILVSCGADTSFIDYNPYHNSDERNIKILPTLLSLDYYREPEHVLTWFTVSKIDINVYHAALKNIHKFKIPHNVVLHNIGSKPLDYWQISEKYINLKEYNTDIMHVLSKENNMEVLRWVIEKNFPIENSNSVYYNSISNIDISTYKLLEKTYQHTINEDPQRANILFWTYIDSDFKNEVLNYWKDKKIEFFNCHETTQIQSSLMQQLAYMLQSDNNKNKNDAQKKLYTVLDYIYTVEPHNIDSINKSIEEFKDEHKDILKSFFTFYELQRDLPLTKDSKRKVKI